MRDYKLVPVLLLACCAGLVTPRADAQAGAQPGSGNQPAGLVRVLAPRPGEKLAQNFVQVQYELTAQASPAASPTFELQLDNHDPIFTTFHEHTFTGLTLGTHEIFIQVVDANHTPVAGTSTKVQFGVLPSPAGPTLPKASVKTGGSVEQAALQEPSPKPPAGKSGAGSGLPRASSALPLISLVGFGTLVTGAISAMRGRKE